MYVSPNFSVGRGHMYYPNQKYKACNNYEWKSLKGSLVNGQTAPLFKKLQWTPTWTNDVYELHNGLYRNSDRFLKPSIRPE